MAQLMFEGLKVLDCSSFIAAPAAATILSDFGADVIKIESPGAGDPYRAVPSLPTMPQATANYAWLLASRNKRGLALNLAKPAAQDVVRRLVGQADIFITNFPAAVRKKLGLQYEDLAPLNYRLIYASFTGYGEHGEEAAKPGFDITAWWARSGLMDGVRTEATAPPARSLTGMGDHPSGITLYASIVIGVLTVASPICVEGQQKVRPRRPPAVGQHTDEILREAGYDAAAVEKLRSDGAVA